MHAVIINGSPRVQKHSNTAKIIRSFADGLCRAGNTCDVYAISERSRWDAIRKAYENNDIFIIALPLFVECVPGLLMEFLEQLPKKDKNTKLAFILQSGFSEGVQLRCGEAYLEMLADRLGCTYAGTLVKGGNFMIRFKEEKAMQKAVAPYRKMGEVFAKDGNFFSKKCKRFTGPEIYPKPMRKVVDKVLHTGAKQMFEQTAAAWGCTQPLDDRPYEE